MNILGPFNETPEGYKYILTVMDFYSKWVEAFPICNKSPADVTVCLKLLYYRHGAWKSILSNEGEEFLEKVSLFCSVSNFFVCYGNVKCELVKKIVNLTKTLS